MYLNFQNFPAERLRFLIFLTRDFKSYQKTPLRLSIVTLY